MTQIPIEIKYTQKHLNSKIKYKCPDCGVEMERKERTHSPTSACFHSICPTCKLEFCDYYSSYWCIKPKNKEAFKEVEML